MYNDKSVCWLTVLCIGLILRAIKNRIQTKMKGTSYTNTAHRLSIAYMI